MSRYENLGVHYTLTVLGCIATVMVSFKAQRLFIVKTQELVLTKVYCFAGTHTVSILQVWTED